jgi:hypothetical protein
MGLCRISTHHGKDVTRWFAKHPRFMVHFTPVHGSWMHQVEQWFSILQRKRLRSADFASKDGLRAKLAQFINASRRDIIASPGSIIWGPVQIMWAWGVLQNECLWSWKIARLRAERAISASRNTYTAIKKGQRPRRSA